MKVEWNQSSKQIIQKGFPSYPTLPPLIKPRSHIF